jgi:hypothetical protein
MFPKGIVKGKLDQLRRCFEVRNMEPRYSGIIDEFILHLASYLSVLYCFYAFQVQFAAGRDLTPGQLNNMIETLSDWSVSIQQMFLHFHLHLSK